MIPIKAPFRRQGIITAVKNPYPGRKPYELLYKTPSILLRHQRKATQLRGHLTKSFQLLFFIAVQWRERKWELALFFNKYILLMALKIHFNVIAHG